MLTELEEIMLNELIEDFMHQINPYKQVMVDGRGLHQMTEEIMLHRAKKCVYILCKHMTDNLAQKIEGNDNPTWMTYSNIYNHLTHEFIDHTSNQDFQ